MLLLDFINVGYGDALLIRDSQTGFSMLVDCGDGCVLQEEGRNRMTAAEFLKRENIRVLDLVVLTHLHRDHCGALKEIADFVEIQNLWSNYLPPRPYWGGKVPRIRRLEQPGRRDLAGMLLEAMDGVLYALGKQPGMKVSEITCTAENCRLTPELTVEVTAANSKVLKEQAEIWETVFSGQGSDTMLRRLDGFINHTSLRLRLCYHGQYVELPADLSADEFDQENPTKCHILKLGHHGHRDSMNLSLLERLKPQIVVISVAIVEGDVCPDQQILHLLEAHGCRVYITDTPCEMSHTRSSIQIVLQENTETTMNHS